MVIAAALAASLPAAAQVESSCSKRTRATVEFVGRVTAIEGSNVAYRILSVTSGTAGVDAIKVEYPGDDNVRFVEANRSYRVAAHIVGGRYRSVVPTAQNECGTVRTDHANGSAIDTGTFAGVKDRLPGIARTLAIVVAAALLVLILVGRVFDRRRAYR